MKKIILLCSFLIIISCLNIKNNEISKRKSSSSYSMSSHTTSFSSFSSDGTKPEKHTKSISTEEYREKEGDNPEQIRKYGEMFIKDNDNPAEIKRKANTNVENEEIILKGNSEDKKIVNSEEEKKFMNKFNLRDDFFNHGLGFGSDFLKNDFFNIENQFNNLGNLRHGNYDKFLEERKNKLIKQKKK